MPMPDVDDLPGAPWGVSAAYLYTLNLDGPALAWEYLRRNPRYRAQYAASVRRAAWPRRWGLRCAEDPRLDAREVCPLWRASTDGLLHVLASHTPDPAGRFDLWRVPGRKRLALGEDGLVLHTVQSGSRLRVLLDARLTDGAGYFCGVPLTAGLRDRLGDFLAQAKALEGQALKRAPARPAGRAALLHLRALQALDAAQAGASHRRVAQALFDLETVARRWQDDGELRAQVRHLLRRATAYMAGGYLALAGVPQPEAISPGDEAPR